MNKSIKELLDNGLITQKEYDILFEDKSDFPFKHIEYFNRTFQKVIDLQSTNSNILDINDIQFINFSIQNFNIPERISFGDNKFYGETDLGDTDKYDTPSFSFEIYSCTFYGKLNLIYTYYDFVHFHDVEFYDVVFISDSSFNELSLKNSYAHKGIFFENFEFGTYNLSGSHFPHIVFSNLSSIDNRTLSSTNFGDKETLTIIKTSFEKQKNISESNKFFALEQDKFLHDLIYKHINYYKNDTKIKKLKTILKNSWQNKGIIFTIFLQKIISNHGTSWPKVFGWIMIFTLLVYFIHEGFPSSKETWMQMPHRAIELIDPLNMFKVNNDIYKGKEFWGFIIRITTLYLFWQFITSFRQNTRRK